MPFDTTYYFYTADQNISLKHIVPGGGNVEIYLSPGELPPGMDSATASLILPYTAFTDVKNLPKEEYPPAGDTLIPLFVLLVVLIFIIKRGLSNSYEKDEDPVKKRPYLTYHGDRLNYRDEQYETILAKHFPYFNALSITERERFKKRVKRFIADKTFKIHDKKGYKEMPILISASAIQLSFGLNKYLLPNFMFIHVYPKEFMRVKPVLCFLEGNVSGHAIKLSWKHYMDGIRNSVDGKNVGLHEMAHALYYQTFVTEENIDTRFRDGFDSFNRYCSTVIDQEQLSGYDLYSDYAMTNFQEFWAESIELFFERPADLHSAYPELYVALRALLNQDPLARSSGQG